MSSDDLRLEPPREGRVDILFVAGEHSGDQHAALIAKDMMARNPDWKLAAMGGPSLHRAGVQLLHDLTKSSVVGLVEVLKHYGTFKRLFENLLDWIEEYRPKAVVLVDYPGFNLRIAQALAKRGISRKGGGDVVVYQYVSPQIWAWKAGRRFKMARILDGLGAIFPFELDCYKDTDLPVTFVGHPFARKDYENPVTYDPGGPVLLLPGSRMQAVTRIFPIMVKAVERYRSQGGTRPCVCLYPESELQKVLENILVHSGLEAGSIILRSVESGATASTVLTSSGTMSLNCALAGIPGAIVYKAHPLTAWMGRKLLKVPYLGIANLVLNKTLYPEFLQQDAEPDKLAEVIESHLSESSEANSTFMDGARELMGIFADEQATPVAVQVKNLIG